MILDSASAGAVGDAGGKGAALARLKAAGFNVPDFFVIPATAIRDGALAAEDVEAIAAAARALGGDLFAVRSSAREEDGASHSHAGQFLSVLDVPADRVAAEACNVWRSGLQDNVRSYRESRGLDAAGGAPSIVVQRMVRARAAGVMFSADPVSGRRDRVVVSATAGLGDKLVGGEVDGDDYTLERVGGLRVAGADGGVLSEGDLSRLHKLALAVEAHFGAPQDMEWAFEGDDLFLLQARPITTRLLDPPINDPAVAIFDNSNIIESYPGLVSPLTYSFAQYVYARVYRTFVRVVGVRELDIRRNAATFENMLGRVDGRIYYNLPNWYRALALLPGFSINRSHMESMMGVDEPLPREMADALSPAPARGLARVAEYGRVGRMVFRLAFEGARLKRTTKRFYQRLDTALARPAAELDAMPLSALAREYRRIEADLLQQWDAPLINDMLCMMMFGASRKLVEKRLGADSLHLHNDIMIGQGDIISAEPAQRIRRMGEIARGDAAALDALKRGDRAALAAHPALAREIEAYIAKFGDRCTEELKLESITLDEDPRALFASVAAAAEHQHEARAETGDASERLREAFGGRRLAFHTTRFVVGIARNLVRNRENLRFERTRIFGRARRLFLAMGKQFAALGHIGEPRDIFYLTLPEALGAVEGFAVTQDLRGLVALRKTEAEAAARRPDPAARLVISGAAITGLANAHAAAPKPPEEGVARKGAGCSAGLVTARARVIRDPRTQALERGEILVARHTDPGWIAVFSNASAIVVERGSLLSHSAIVARELGIPCVVGLKEATRWIADGEMIEVDGASGHVRKIDG